MIKSNLKGKDYNQHDVIRIVNHKQYTLYVKNGVYPIDIYASIDDKSNNDILAFVFLKSDTSEVYKKWCNYELK